MNAGPSSDHPQGNDLDPRHEELWRLLGRAPMPEPGPWFATHALARCRVEKRAAESLARMWRWALGGGLGVCLAMTLVVAQFHPQKAEPRSNANVQEAFEIMASIDNSDTDSSASSSSWQDTSL